MAALWKLHGNCESLLLQLDQPRSNEARELQHTICRIPHRSGVHPGCVEETEQLHSFAVESLVQGKQQSFPETYGFDRNMPGMVHRVTVRTEHQQIRRIIPSTFTDIFDVVNLQGED